MRYKELGRTGIKISALGFGAMRLPQKNANGRNVIDKQKAIDVLIKGFNLGINYIDTAYSYNDGESERVVGEALKEWQGNRIYTATKLPVGRIGKASDYRKYLEEELKRMGKESIDFYFFHALSWNLFKERVVKYDLIKEALKAKEEGLINHISFSFHDEPRRIKDIIDAGYGVFDTVLCQYNLLDRSNESMMKYAKDKGVGVIVMGPVAGGNLAFPSKVLQNLPSMKTLSTARIALKFVFSNPNVDVALSGMNTIDMVEENVAEASKENILDKRDLKNISVMMDKMRELSQIYCTDCKYCIPCPIGVNIPMNFKALIMHKVYGLVEPAQKLYDAINDNYGKTADACIKCGKCLKKCPQGINIIKQLEETVNLFK